MTDELVGHQASKMLLHGMTKPIMGVPVEDWGQSRMVKVRDEHLLEWQREKQPLLDGGEGKRARQQAGDKVGVIGMTRT